MKKLNLPLIFGSIILLMILFTCMFPKAFTRINPYGIQNTKTSISQQGVMKLEGAPFKPTSEEPLGTDELGRDVLSLIVYGTKLTMILGALIVAGRFLIALPIGIWAAFGSHTCRALINQFNAIFSAIPSLIICIIILKMNFFSTLHKEGSILAFVVVLTFAGWSKLGLLIMERVEDILSKPFIKGEIAIGKSSFQIALQNVVPHLSAELVVLVFMELAMALSMVMQLGVFGVFIGNLKVMADSGVPANINYEPEWGGMLSTGRVYLQTAPWIVLSPAVAFFISILGANLFGEGIRIKIQGRDSNFIVRVRRALSFDGSASSAKKIRIAAVCCLLIILSVFGFNIGRDRIQAISAVNIKSVIDEFEYDSVIVGSDEAGRIAAELSKELKNIGYEPLKGENYEQVYEVKNVYAPVQSLMEITSPSGKLTLKQGEDYSFYGYGNYDISGEILDLRNQDIYTLNDFNSLKGRFVLLDSSLFSNSAIDYFSDKIIKEYGANGVLWGYSKGNKDIWGVVSRTVELPVIYLSEDAIKNIDMKNSSLKAQLKSIKVDGKGRNVMGIIKGNDPKVGKDAIIIGVGYNYMHYEKDAALSRLKIILELAKKIKSQEKDLNRSIIIAFFDGTTSEAFNGIKVYSEDSLYPREDCVLFIDLTEFKSNRANLLDYNGAKAPITRYFAWNFKRNLEKEFQENNLIIDRYVETRSVNEIMDNMQIEDQMFYKGAIPTIILGSNQGESGKEFTLEEITSMIYSSIVNNTN